MFFNNKIRKAVMKVIKTKIDEKQKSYDDGVKNIEETLENDIQTLEGKAEQNKTDLAAKLVKEIIGDLS